MRTRTRIPAQRRRCSGFSIVDVVVALMLVAIGLLGLAGSTTLALRSTLDAAHRREVAARADSRLAQLDAAGCARAVDGFAIDSVRQLAERWTVSATSNGYTTVTDRVDWMSARGARSFALTSALTC